MGPLGAATAMALAAAGVGTCAADPDPCWHGSLLNPLFPDRYREATGGSDLPQGGGAGAGRQCNPAHRTNGDRR
jgi:hypothetical protein